ncbi:hypothetical protein [Streptomyces sp. NPDC048669]|uniref:hypothetical protein n=1 Tax=Streptomyces sp. NPDC048669 TaxID=3155267 RepID=UPI00343BA490
MRVPAHDLDAELDRIASDPGTRALFHAELGHALAEHIPDAAEAQRAVVQLPTWERAA